MQHGYKKGFGALTLLLIIAALGFMLYICRFDHSGVLGEHKLDISAIAWDRYLSKNIELSIRTVPGNKNNSITNTVIYLYDYEQLALVEKRLSGINREAALIRLFQQAKSQSANNDDTEIWSTILNLLNHSLRHDPIVQPMYQDKNMVTDPLVLLELGDGRCGHVARVVVDLAIANGYQARLVNVAAHIVAEVFWHDEWHMIDADSDFPIEQYRSLFPDLPSVEKLAATPYLLDALPANGWIWGENYRRAHSLIIPEVVYYPATVTTSSVYFGDKVTSGEFYSPGGKRTKFQYQYKNGSALSWQADKYYGWRELRIENKAIPLIPTKFQIVRPQLMGPDKINIKSDVKTFNIPISIASSYRPFVKSESNLWDIGKDFTGIEYEIIVSSRSRGWDYDYHARDLMGRSASGDIYRARINGPTDKELFMHEVTLNATPVFAVFIEIKPLLNGAENNEFVWPSNEICVFIVRDHRPQI